MLSVKYQFLLRLSLAIVWLNESYWWNCCWYLLRKSWFGKKNFLMMSWIKSFRSVALKDRLGILESCYRYRFSVSNSDYNGVGWEPEIGILVKLSGQFWCPLRSESHCVRSLAHFTCVSIESPLTIWSRWFRPYVHENRCLSGMPLLPGSVQSLAKWLSFHHLPPSS